MAAMVGFTGVEMTANPMKRPAEAPEAIALEISEVTVCAATWLSVRMVAVTVTEPAETFRVI